MPQYEQWWMMKALMTAWRMIVQARALEAASKEALRLGKLVGNKGNSIWLMNKEELVELAMEELGFSRRIAEKDTVTVLRERLRRNRDLMKEEADPMAAAPKGLEKMVHSDLVRECSKRGISVEPLPGQRGAIATRPQMILKIREDVELRSMPSAGAATATASSAEPSRRPRPSTAPANDMGFYVVPEETAMDEDL